MSEITELILKEIRARNYNEAKRLLDKLDLDLNKLNNLQKFFDEIKGVVEKHEKQKI